MFKKVENEIVSPITGKAILLEQVPDKVFASKMMGDGIGFIINDGKVCSPIDGEITMIPETNHAFGVTGKSNFEILVHIGIDTVTLKGMGFKRLVSVGELVKKGDPIIEVTEDLFNKENIDLTTIMIFTNGSEFNIDFKENIKEISTGRTIIATYSKK